MATKPPSGQHVDTVCPLDCPDACSLSVGVEKGRVISVDGSHANPVTGGYICAKVRRFGERIYGPDRLLHPMVRKGPKGVGLFERVSWEEALGKVATAMEAAREEFGGESILPYSYGGSNGLLTQDTSDATLFARMGASRLARTLCAAPTGVANMTLYGKMPSVCYADYPGARLILLWGCNPNATGLHLVPAIRQAQRNGAVLVVIDPRVTPLARLADIHLAVRPGTDLPVALAIHRHLFEEGFADATFLAAHTVGADRLRGRAAEWTMARAAEEAGIRESDLRRVADLYATTSPALVRCGWGQERNRNGGNASMAILALPAVGGKFGVRGGGYAMSNSASWGISKTWVEPGAPGRRVINMTRLGRTLLEATDPPVKVLFSYNCNPVATVPDQRRVQKGLLREDLFTVVFDQVMTDTTRYADVLLPATTFLEGYDLVRGYGSMSLQLGRPAIEPVGEARSNADVFGELLQRLDLATDDDVVGELDEMLDILARLPDSLAEGLRDRGAATPPWNGRPVQFVDVHPLTPDGKVHLFDDGLDREAPTGLYGYQADPATPAFPLALISPASERTISSTLGELPRPESKAVLHPDDAAARGIEDGDEVRLHNALGEVRCHVTVAPGVRAGTVSLPKGLWSRHTLNGATSNTLIPDTLTDLGGGACYNDARVQVEKVPTGVLRSGA